MELHSIKLTQFRNHSQNNFELHAKCNALVGLNGVGKTSVLDAIYYCCLGKSYLSSTDKTIIKNEEDFFRLDASFTSENDYENVVIKTPLHGKKEIIVNGKKIDRISDHVGRFPCVIITPDDIHKMLDGSEERRIFINNMIMQTDKQYVDDIVLYNQLLKRRNALLKSFAENKRRDLVLLEAISQKMYEPAARIYTKRLEYITTMIPIFVDKYKEISGDRENCQIQYKSELQHRTCQELFESSIEKDCILQRTNQGIHKDDLEFFIDNNPLKSFASQGQLKSFVLSLKLAQYKLVESKTNKKPILLLDDVFDKLDQSRVLQLINLLLTNEYGQIIITDTEGGRLQPIFEQLQSSFRIFVLGDAKINHVIDN